MGKLADPLMKKDSRRFLAAYVDVVTNLRIFDLCGFPKDGYWHHRAMWSAEPILHLMPHWNQSRKEVKVWALTNVEEVELFLNGNYLGSRKISRGGHGEWIVPYSPGTVRATGWIGGKKVADISFQTTGPVKSLLLDPDRNRMAADGRDAVPVRISVTDSQGRVVPTACVPIRLKVSGPARIVGLGNGDPASNDRKIGSRVKSFNGYCMVILQSTGKRGRITLTAGMSGAKTTAAIKAG